MAKVAAVADSEVEVIQAAVQMAVEETVDAEEVVATTAVAVTTTTTTTATIIFKMVRITKQTGWSNLVINNLGRHKITIMLIMGLREAVGKSAAVLMDRALHIRTTMAITIKEVGDVQNFEKR
jgi:hypothetical protein